MTNRYRIIHAISFEVGALFLFIFLFAPFTDHSAKDMGVLAIGLSLLTVAILYFYNLVFDRVLQARTGSLKKSVTARIVHALVFETALLVVSLPLVAWWLNTGLREAIAIEIAAITIMVIYTYVFHFGAEKLFGNPG